MNNLTRQSVDRAEPLQFPAGKRSAVVHISYKGVPVDVTVDDANAVAVEKLVDSLLSREGWAAPSPAGVNTRAEKPKRQQPAEEPYYDGDGEPCCPKHKRRLKAGQHGDYQYCTAKDETGRNGYCEYRFNG